MSISLARTNHSWDLTVGRVQISLDDDQKVTLSMKDTDARPDA
jgi:hypothetical protein